MTNIPIFLSSDNNYAPFVATTIASICHNTKSFCDFYVFDGGISAENKLKIEKLKNSFNNFTLEFIEVNEQGEFSSIEYQNVASHVSLSTYNRFLIPRLKPNLSKVLYLDVDIIVLKDIENLYNISLQGYPLAAVPESFFNTPQKLEIQKRLNLGKNHQYFNAGVLLIDNNYWVKNKIFSKVLETEQIYRENLKFADQDILNIVFNENFLVLPEQFNYMSQFKTKNKQMIIRHFNTNTKPWQLKPSKHTINDVPLFWEYAKMTSFYYQLYQKIPQQKIWKRCYNLFCVFPILKVVKKKNNKKKWFLFGLLPILEVSEKKYK